RTTKKASNSSTNANPDFSGSKRAASEGFDEITASNLLEVNQDLEPINQEGMANPANRFHKNVNLLLEVGEKIAILGANGVGKST
ncbi:hypothetical protein ACTXQV_69430, partial [Klebsiella pneumoniae]